MALSHGSGGAAHEVACDALDHALAGHVSAEAGHRMLLDELGLKPLLDLDMRLGEASGAAVAVWYCALRSPATPEWRPLPAPGCRINPRNNDRTRSCRWRGCDGMKEGAGDAAAPST